MLRVLGALLFCVFGAAWGLSVVRMRDLLRRSLVAPRGLAYVLEPTLVYFNNALGLAAAATVALASIPAYLALSYQIAVAAPLITSMAILWGAVRRLLIEVEGEEQ